MRPKEIIRGYIYERKKVQKCIRRESDRQLDFVNGLRTALMEADDRLSKIGKQLHCEHVFEPGSRASLVICSKCLWMQRGPDGTL